MGSFDTWWYEEREASYRSMRIPFMYLTLLNILIKFLLCKYSDECIFCELILLYGSITCIILTSIVLLIEKKFPKEKYILGIIMCEIQTLLFIKLAREFTPDQKETLNIGSTAYIVIFEVALVKQLWFLLVMLMKFIYMLYFGDIFRSNINPLEFTTPFIPCIFVIVSVLICENCKRQRMFQMYELKRKYQKTCHKLDAFLDAVPEALIVLTDENNIELFNKAAKELFKCTDAREMMDSLKRLRYSANRRGYSNIENSCYIYDDIKNYIHTSHLIHQNFGVVVYNGLNLEIIGNKVLTNEYQATIFTARDSTAFIQLEETRAESKWKTAMLRTVSHELRTPATGIISFSDQVIETETHISQDSKQKLKMVSVCSNLLLHLINDLLDFTQILAGTFKIHKSYFNLKEQLRTCLSLIEMQSKKKNIRTLLTIDPLLPKNVYTDSNRLSQIILNLLSNALKYTMSGSIKMVCYSNINDNLEIVIEDTGIGIPQYKLNSLFSIFGNFHDAPICPQGSGIGLHISNLLVKALGGSGFKVKSEIGKGSKFGFYVDIYEHMPDLSGYEISIASELPEEQETSITLHSLIASGSYQNRSNNILIVDDNEFVRTAVAYFLTNAGLAFEEACTGKQALERVIYRNRIGIQFKVIIMDCEMPEMDGWEATREIHLLWETGRISELPIIIAHTAFVGEEENQRCREAGMRETLFKPTGEHKFIQTIKNFLK